MHPRRQIKWDIVTETYKTTNIKINTIACFRKHIQGFDTAWQNIHGKPPQTVSKLSGLTTIYKRITQPKHGEARKTFVPT